MRWVRPILRISAKSRARGGEARQEVFVHLLQHRQVHGRRKDIVGGLPQVDVVVGVHRTLAAPCRSQALVDEIGNDLIDVHVALGAAARLPDAQGEMGIPAPRRHLRCRLGNGGGQLGGEQTKLSIDQGRCPLDLRQGVDQLQRHGLGANGKMLQRTLGLRAPEGVRRHPYHPQAVPLVAPGLRHRRTPAPGTRPAPPDFPGNPGRWTRCSDP